MIEYDPHTWRHFWTAKGSMLPAIVQRALPIGGVALLVSALHARSVDVAIEPLVHVLVGPAISFLLVFRTNASYDRFWEGRKIWGTIVNASRNLARLVSVSFPPQEAQQQKVLLQLMPRAIMQQLRDAQTFDAHAATVAPQFDAAFKSTAHRPSAVAHVLSARWATAESTQSIHTLWRIELERLLQVLIDSSGACERIHRTPLPFAYVVHLRRALVLYCLTLPSALVAQFHWATPLICFGMAALLFGIEEIGVEIEDPFGTDDNDLPLETICTSIEEHVGNVLPPLR